MLMCTQKLLDSDFNNLLSKDLYICGMRSVSMKCLLIVKLTIENLILYSGKFSKE